MARQWTTASTSTWVTVVGALLVCSLTACEVADSDQSVAGARGKAVKLEFHTAPQPEEYGTFLYEWECIPGSDAIRFQPTGGGKDWTFACEPFVPKMPTRIEGGHRGRKVLNLRGSLQIPGDQPVGLVDGYIVGQIIAGHMVDSRHFVVATRSIRHAVHVKVEEVPGAAK